MVDYGAIPPPPPPPPPGYAPPRAPSSGVVIAVGVILAVTIVIAAAGAGILVNRMRPSSSHHAAQGTGGLTATSGALVFTDEFHDPSSGWTTEPLASGTTFAYSGGEYVVVAKGSLHHFSGAPYDVPLAELSMSVTATQSSDAPEGAGFGVTCAQGSGAQHIRYQFLVVLGGLFFIERKIGPDGGNVGPTVVKQGTSSASPGSTPMTLVGDCITAADGQSTRLVLFIDGTMTADVTDTASVPSDGWLGGLDVSSIDTNPSTVSVTKFEERDVSR
jgi:hypothetical protein